MRDAYLRKNEAIILISRVFETHDFPHNKTEFHRYFTTCTFIQNNFLSIFLVSTAKFFSYLPQYTLHPYCSQMCDYGCWVESTRGLVLWLGKKAREPKFKLVTP